MRREWIEIVVTKQCSNDAFENGLPMRREWIEINFSIFETKYIIVSLHAEGWIEILPQHIQKLYSFRLPPCGGSGLK